MNEYENNMFREYPDVVEVRDLQKMLSAGRNSILGLLSSGTIQSFRIGNRYKIPKTSVINYINTQLGY